MALQALYARRQGLPAPRARPHPQTTARPPLKHTKGRGAGPGGPRCFLPPPGTHQTWSEPLDQLNPAPAAPAPAHANSYLVCVLDLHVAAAAAAGLARLVRILVLPPDQEHSLDGSPHLLRCQQRALRHGFSAGPHACTAVRACAARQPEQVGIANPKAVSRRQRLEQLSTPRHGTSQWY